MDRGAHFHKCDFQVHTPRDTNWQGPRPVSDDERKKYAERFILACRERVIDAVAITDHHDMAFFKYIRDAAQNEVDDRGNPIPENDKIIIFPGMELTLGIPCQAILILDADFPETLLGQVATTLSIVTNDSTEPMHADISRLEHITSFSKLYEILDTQDFLLGRYIVLPNVTDGGHGTLLRSGFAAHYKDMPCVGGYLDCSHESLGSGNREILNGRNRDYGFKPL